MPIKSSVFQEFLTAEIVDALKMAEIFRPDINLPLVGSDFPPIIDFCTELKYRAEKIIEKNEKLKILLNAGANPNVSAKYTRTPLTCALEYNAGIEFVEMLINANAEINFPDEYGNTALFFASYYRRLDELRLLVKRGGLINHLNKKGETILTSEINRKEPSLDVVNALINLGADVNASASLHAALSGWGKALHIVNTLIDSGADVNSKNTHGVSPLALAAAENKCPVSILETLVASGAVIDSVDDKGWTPLLHATSSGNAEAVKFLLNRKASVKHRDADGKSALHWCCKKGHAAIVSLLVNAGADVNLADKVDSDYRWSTGGHTPLIYSIYREDVTEELLKFNPDVNWIDDKKMSALMHAVGVYSGKGSEIVRLLLKKSAKVDLEDVDGNTALHLMVKNYHLTASKVKILLGAKLNVNAQNRAGETPLMLCSNVKAMQILIRGGALLNLVDQAGKTALIHCFSHYESDKHLKVKALLSAKCDPNVRDVEGKTALMYAVRSDTDVKTVRLLVDHGANLDLLDNKDQPATAHASPDNLMLLISVGAKPSSFEGNKLLNAVHDDNLPLATLLLERGAKMKLKLERFIKYKKILEKMARANSNLLRCGVECTDPEAQEQFDALLAKFKRNPNVADDSDLPEILRMGAWPVKIAARKEVVMPSARIDVIDKSIDYFKGNIDWPADLKELVLRKFRKYGAQKNSTYPDPLLESPREYFSSLLQKRGTINFSALFKNWTKEGDAEFVEFWNANAPTICEKVSIGVSWRPRAIDVDKIFYLLARFGIAALPGILGTKIRPSVLTDALRFVDAPACARLMSRGLFSGLNTRVVRQWISSYPESCAKGLIVDAISKTGKDRSAAEVGLRFLASKGHRSIVESVAAQFGSDVVESIAETLSQDHRADFIPAKAPKMPKFWSADVYPAPRLKSNNKELPDYSIATLANMMSLSNSEVRTPALDAVLEACDPKSLASFSWGAFEEWAAKGQKDSEWIFDSLSYLGDDTCARKLTPYIRNWPSENGIARARKGLEILAAIGSDVALSQIQAISQKNKYQSVLESAQEMMKKIAVARDLKPQQLEDQLVPDLGLSEMGEIKLNLGSRYFTGSVDAMLKPVIRDSSGAIVKALPDAGKDDDKALAKESAAAWSDLCKELRPVAKLQLKCLELAMVNSRRWSGAEFKTLFVVSPLLQNLVKGLVWGIFSSNSELSTSFMVNADNAFVDTEGNSVKVSDGASIGIVHPLLLDEASLAAWKKLFAKNKQIQPFAQLVRKTYRAIDDTEKNRFGLDGATVASKALKGLLAIGWSSSDNVFGGSFCEFVRGQSYLNVQPGVHLTDYEMFSSEQKIKVEIRDALSPVEFSEIVRELMTLKK